MFTAEQRSVLRASLLERAQNDPHITSAAITGSAASDSEDRWSDIDLAFAVAGSDSVGTVLSHWTEHMYSRHHALHHMDVKAGAWIYRVFLLPDTLQVDLAFVPAGEFRPLGATFRLVFGSANPAHHFPPPQANDIIGFAWLYALHARSCIARRKLWQAEYMISGIRDSALQLACLRLALPVIHGRGFDQLPETVTAPFHAALVQKLETPELRRALSAAINGFLGELETTDPALAKRLQQPLTLLNSSLES